MRNEEQKDTETSANIATISNTRYFAYAETFSMDIEKFLNPFPGKNPAGESLRYDELYDNIKESRREDDTTLPRGIWEKNLKKADWDKVRTLCFEALEKRSKDLQIAVWLAEAFLCQHGFAGLKESLKLIVELCVRFWDHLYPEIEQDDVETRISPIVWFNEKFSLKLKMVNITLPDSSDYTAYTFADWERMNMLENLAIKNKAIRDSEIDITRTNILRSAMFTPIEFYSRLSINIKECFSLLTRLDTFLEEKCGKSAPSLKFFSNIMELILKTTNIFLKQKGESEDNMESSAHGIEMQNSKIEEGDKTIRGSGFLAFRNRADAYRMLSEAADYLQIHEPHSPTPYLVRRAISWGHMTLEELLTELIGDQNNLEQILKLLGLDGRKKKQGK